MNHWHLIIIDRRKPDHILSTGNSVWNHETAIQQLDDMHNLKIYMWDLKDCENPNCVLEEMAK
jgi:hypothetical protein